ncbi:3-methylornithyl-N6-L-lysine dehydrogenase PylD [Desulfitobacterium chlororespirans]|uniref:Pyrrolysine biosynthesis protein PylD n=1 Tax=Desulfitobacterium chlororespirans DSM 11544 TaxID=1121395 RepID=A0A1M7TDU7_9FIRM|nr:3-methylornithyl-N6-L-lysine dehydrogenase PylD [Desulfitobacterium chlororespirans]SHN68838.1 pyrrolysine biosynthesis protein PylD [Desulfitobacterium chlororespirans DSM 11544]
MTRLQVSDIELILEQMNVYDRELLAKTGYRLSHIAAHAVGRSWTDVPDPGLIAVVPMTCGLGVISGFAETVAGILRFLGMNTFVPVSPDVKGFAEALERQAEIIFMADEERFIGVHLKTGQISDNSVATGRGFAAALDCLTGGLRERDVLILGAGPVGRAAAFAVLDFGGNVHVLDKDLTVSEKLAHEMLCQRGCSIGIEKGLDSALGKHRAIVVACPEGGLLRPDHLHTDTCIAAPGVPLGIQPHAIKKVEQRLIHDPLQLGVATMLYEILAKISPPA